MDDLEEESCHQRIRVDGFGFMPNTNDIVRRYTIKNKNNAVVRLISLGAGVQSLSVPNRNDDINDVALGFDDVNGYLDNRYIGRIVGRVSNSFIAKNNPTKISLQCSDEDDDDQSSSFDLVNWDSHVLGNQVVMTRVSHDGCEGYPGDLFAQVKYTWTDENKLHVDVSAMSTKPTPVDISSHCLFNLAGHGMGAKELRRHVVTINAEQLAHLDLERGCSSGVIENVHETIYDLRKPARLDSKRLYGVPGGGYNHNYSIVSPKCVWCYRFHARIIHPGSGRYLEVYSNHPAAQFYTGNELPPNDADAELSLSDDYRVYECGASSTGERLIGKDGVPYRRHGCFALVPQGYPKTLTCESFPSMILHPGKVYKHSLTYAFGLIAQ